MKKLTVSYKENNPNPGGNWNVAKDWFPTIEVDQETGEISVEYFNTKGYQKKAVVETEEINEDISKDGDQVFVRGEVYVKNWVNRYCSKPQKFCFAIFIGDSGHIYVHRAPATKGWMEAKPETIRKRLRKLGIGVENPAYQQGDLLLKKANGNALPDEEFKHETKGSGHHLFSCPVLYAIDASGNRQYFITEPTELIHHAVDGIQHPTLIIEPGKYIVGTTSEGLRHSNKRD